MKLHPEVSDLKGKRHLNQHPLPKEVGLKIIGSSFCLTSWLTSQNTAKCPEHWWPGAARISYLRFKHWTCGPENIKITLSNSMFMYYRFSDLSLPGEVGKYLVLWTLTRKAPWSFSHSTFLKVSLSGKMFHRSLHQHTLFHKAMLHQTAASTLHLFPIVNEAMSDNEQHQIIGISSSVKVQLSALPHHPTPPVWWGTRRKMGLKKTNFC